MNTILLNTNWQELVGATGNTLLQSQDNEIVEVLVSDVVPSADKKGVSLMPFEKLNIYVSSKAWVRTSSGSGYLVYYSNGGVEDMEKVITSWETVFTSSTNPPTPFVIGTNYVDITSLIGSFSNATQGPSPIFYDAAKNRFFCSENTKDYYSFSLIWRLSGSVGISVNQSSEFLIEIRRGDGTTVLPAKRVFMKGVGGSPTFVNEAVMDIKIRVFAGGADPFQDRITPSGGFKVFVRKLSGNDLTLNFNDTTNPKVSNTFLFVR